MPTKINLIKTQFNSFVAAYDSDAENMRKVNKFKVYECSISAPRNQSFHRKGMCLFNFIYKYWGKDAGFPSFDIMRKHITKAVGFVDEYKICGKWYREAKSLAFASMDDIEFSQLYDAVRNYGINALRITGETFNEQLGGEYGREMVHNSEHIEERF